jgi:thiamine-monophosphate kinase
MGRSTVRQLGEVGVITRVSRRLPVDRSVFVGVGDDAAVLRCSGSRWLLLASDMLVEGVHFNRRRTSPRWIGWKALAANISDLAAMGGRPRWAVVSLGLPPGTPVRFVDGLYEGLNRCARRFGMAIVGGDTVRAPRVVVDVAILGQVRRERLVLRRGARVGDALFVTGRLGGSYASGRHARFTPRLAEAQALLRRVRVHAMMDLSDGLASDLWQMSRQSHVRFRVEEHCVPVAPEARSLESALMEGEDFELLFAVGARQASRVPGWLGRVPVTRVGCAVGRGVGVELVRRNGCLEPLKPQGFRHF